MTKTKFGYYLCKECNSKYLLPQTECDVCGKDDFEFIRGDDEC